MKRTLMIHIPKSAGTSMWQCAEKNVKCFQRLHKMRDQTPGADFTTIGHRSPDALIRRGWMTREWFDSCYKFAFVRNTWDRLSSIFTWYKSFREKRQYPIPSNYCLASFDTFIREITDKDSEWVPRIGFDITQPYFQHARPQLDWLSCGCDFIGRHEHIQEDWEKLCSIIGIPYEPLPKTNSFTRTHYSTMYTNETRDLVGDFYAEEIERFNFTFDGEPCKR